MARDLNKWLFLGFAGTAALLGRIIPASCGEGMPQVRGDDVLAQVLGETRLAVSQALLEKADEYFHGGVRHQDSEHGVVSVTGHDEHGHDHGHEEDACGASCGFDPWGMINRRVHVQEHRHMHGAEANELLPWLWATNRVSSENLQSFQASIYVLNRMLDKPHAALEMLEQGIARNPGSAHLEFERGEMYLNTFKDVVQAEAAFRMALAKNPRGRAEKDEDARHLRLRTLLYLGYLSQRKGDTETLRLCLREAVELSPKHVCTRGLRELVEKGAPPAGVLSNQR